MSPASQIFMWFLIFSPILWIWAKVSYDKRPSQPKRITPLPPKPILTKAQQHKKDHFEWDHDFAAAQVAAHLRNR